MVKVMVYGILIGQYNNTNSFDWLNFNMKNKPGFSVSVRILVVENIVNVCRQGCS